MKRTKLQMEYPLSSKSLSIVWDMIGTASGLQKWMADKVEVRGNEYTFSWGEPWGEMDVRHSVLVEQETMEYVRFRWEVFEPEQCWEIRIEKSDLTGALSLLITDYAEEGEEEYIRGCWDDNMKRLHRVSGF